MSPPTQGQPPRDRLEAAARAAARSSSRCSPSLAVIIVTASLVWFLRPNRDSGTVVGARARRRPRRPRRATTTTTPPGETTTTAPATSRAGVVDALTEVGPRRAPAFEAGLGFPLDPFQERALDALDAGQSVLVAAPTGSGKTIVAEYAVAPRARRRAARSSTRRR